MGLLNDGTFKKSVCPHCEVGITKAMHHHLKRCERATPEERAFYREHRAWPQPSRAKTNGSLITVKLISELNATRKMVCNNPNKCKDAICHLWWAAADLLPSKRVLGNVAEDHGNSHLSVKRVSVAVEGA